MRTHRRARIHTQSHTSPFPKAVCIHFTHAAQKKRGIEILRQSRSPASGLVRDRRVCTVILSSSAGPEASARWKSSLHTCSDQKGFPLRSIFSRTHDKGGIWLKPGLLLSSAARLRLVYLHLFLSGCGAALVSVCAVLGFPLPTSPLSVPLFSHGDR